MIEATGCGLAALQNSLCAYPFDNIAQAIEQGIKRFQQREPQNLR
jgi:hypothetical protein